MDHVDHESNFRNKPQNRRKGSGKGKICRPWVKKWGWLLIATERLFVYKAGSETTLLKERRWKSKLGLTEAWMEIAVDARFPGFIAYLKTTPGGPNPIADLWNRVYKMYYSGSSDRGPRHDPKTRAAVSREHWRSQSYRTQWEQKIIRIVKDEAVCTAWRDWV